MSDFSSLFTAPKRDAYGPDELEANLSAQSASNPYAIMRALSARIRNQGASENYGRDLAAHNEASGARAAKLMGLENQLAIRQDMAKDLGPLLRAQLSDVDPAQAPMLFANENQHYQAKRLSDVAVPASSAVQNLRTAGYKPEDLGRLSALAGLGPLQEGPTLSQLNTMTDNTTKHAKPVGKVELVYKPYGKVNDAGASQTKMTVDLTDDDIKNAEILKAMDKQMQANGLVRADAGTTQEEGLVTPSDPGAAAKTPTQSKTLPDGSQVITLKSGKQAIRRPDGSYVPYTGQ